ncbi:hypothetical protein NE577_17520, partial [Cloacibacillus evryensis]|nr:hypothetical protein [Cloacibacillus evryensis]
MNLLEGNKEKSWFAADVEDDGSVIIKMDSLAANPLDEAVSTRDEKVLVGRGEKYIDGEWLASYNCEHGSTLELSEEKADIAGGFILLRGRTSIDC